MPSVHDLAVHIRDEYDGTPLACDRRRHTDALRANLAALPASQMKIKSLGASCKHRLRRRRRSRPVASDAR